MNRIINQRAEARNSASSSELIREALCVWQRQEAEHQERLDAIRARIQASLDDPRPAVSVAEARDEFRKYMPYRKTDP